MDRIKWILLVAASLSAAVAQAQSAAYIPAMNSDEVSLVNTRNPPAKLRTVTTGTTCPFGSAVSPLNNRIYITNTNVDQAGQVASALECDISGGGNPTDDYENTVAVLDQTGAVLGHIKIDTPNPAGVAVSPDGSHVYVASFGNGSNGTFSIIDAATDEVIQTLSEDLQAGPLNVAVAPDGKYVYVALANRCMIAVIEREETSVYRMVSQVAVGTLLSRGKCTPMDTGGVVTSPDGAWVYVVNNADNSVSVIDARRNLVTHTVTGLSNCPVAGALSPDGRFLYVTVSNGDWDTNCGPMPGKNHGYITRIDTTDFSTQELRPMTGDFFPYGIALTPDGRYVYATDLMNPRVVIIDTNDGSATTLPVGEDAYSVGLFISSGEEG